MPGASTAVLSNTPAPVVPRIPSPRSLRDYVLLADGERGVVLLPGGQMVWMCFPGWADGALFGALLGAPGSYVIQPAGWHVWSGHYEPGTLIWRGRCDASGGILECRDALAYPGEPGRAVILRRLTAVQGSWPVRVSLEPVADYGRGAAPAWRRTEADWSGEMDGVWMRWSGASAMAVRCREGRALEAEAEIAAGAYVDLVLELSTSPLRQAAPDPARLWTQTEKAWHSAVPQMQTTIADRDVRHSYAVLQGLSNPRSGGIVAAATTSLPEHADAGRDYDYRFAWIRDQCFAGEAMAALGGTALLESTVGFITERILEDGPELHPAYTAAGKRIAGHEEIDIPGYPGAPQVRRGNKAASQFQLDVFGEALLLLAAADRLGGLDDRGRRAARLAAGAIEERWRQPDAGIWETQPKLWASGRLLCAAGLRAMAAAAGGGDRGGRWLALADAIVAETAATCTHSSGRWQRAPGDDRIDAALLLSQIRGAVGVDDPRSRLTRAAVDAELGLDGFVYRYRRQGKPLGEVEGAFLLCNFWMAMSVWQAGERARAAMWFERARSACGPAGLFCEEYDVESRQPQGNLPQAFVHAALIETAAAMGGAER